jgi:hypothetical protein
MRLAIALAIITATTAAHAGGGLELSARVSGAMTQHGMGIPVGLAIDTRASPYVGIGLYAEAVPLFVPFNAKCGCESPPRNRPYRGGAFAEVHLLPRGTWDPWLRAAAGLLYTHRVGGDVEANVGVDHRSDAFAIGPLVGVQKPFGAEQPSFGLAVGLRVLITL